MVKLSVRNLEKKFTSKNHTSHALSNLSLEVEAGEFLILSPQYYASWVAGWKHYGLDQALLKGVYSCDSLPPEKQKGRNFKT